MRTAGLGVPREGEEVLPGILHEHEYEKLIHNIVKRKRTLGFLCAARTHCRYRAMTSFCSPDSLGMPVYRDMSFGRRADGRIVTMLV